MEQRDKEYFKKLVAEVTDTLISYLKAENPGDVSPVHLASDRIASFVRRNKKALKGSLGDKILFFLGRTNDSIEFLLATKRHNTPKGLNLVVKIATFLFVIFYPATMLHKTPDETLISLFLSSVIKSVFLISLINVQEMLEDPFNQQGTDNIRMGDFAPTTQLLTV